MNKKLFAVIAATLCVALVAFAGGQRSKSVATRASKGAKGTAQKGEARFKGHTRAKAPVGKGGRATKGAVAATRVHVDNRSNHPVHVWVDGDFAGSVGAYGDLYVYTGNGNTSLYAECTEGDVSWGPTNRYLSGGSFTWTLNP